MIARLLPTIEAEVDAIVPETGGAYFAAGRAYFAPPYFAPPLRAYFAGGAYFAWKWVRMLL